MAELYSSAVLSECGKYRYQLTRQWADGPVMGFIMLNPSTADATVDDPTIRRCIAFATREGCGGLLVMNLFALRATKPSALAQHSHPIGPEWRHWMDAGLARVTGPLVAGWGAQKGIDAAVATTLHVVSVCGTRHEVKCLGTTKDGYPRHPLYVRGDQPLVAL